MENFDNFCRMQLCKKLQNETYLPITAYRSVETVNALHQKVVSLRKCLVEAKLEINSLKSQITVKDSIEVGKLYRCHNIMWHLNEPENKYSGCDKISENYDNCKTFSILNNGSEISHSYQQSNQLDIFQNGDAIDQSIGSYIEIGTVENLFKKRSTKIAANVDVKIRRTSIVSIRDHENDSDSTKNDNSGKLLSY